ncbi:hypothetical protein DW272_01505 [Blautia obeum]|uniref:ABC-transporter type IV n=1 Tax=Blautia obeum TaxID=40520 RepID=A0A414SK19_9FIRM|nr:hypothetical protein [Blautia obeum]RHG19909.1 hypothetical protein DW272_01505 [Blautia obeum]
MKSFMKYLLLFTFSGYIYVCMELLFRGHSDITMMFCASICVIPMVLLNNQFSYEVDFLLQLVLCAIFATFIEYIFGVFFNSDYHIWDYRNMPFNIDGLICLPFSLLWMIIAAWVIPLMDWMDCYIFGYMSNQKPYYKIFGKKIYQMK